MSTECSFNALSAALDKCTYVKENCEFSYFSLLNFNYCIIDNNKWLTFLLLALIIILCFYFLSSTGNDYLAPALGIISEKLHLSQNLAGLTLLALGNQAPDVIVAFVAGDGENEGVETSLGSLLGGGMIVVSLVLSTVVLLGKEVKVIWSNFIRDLGMYLIALGYVTTLGVFGRITLWESCLFLCFYTIYVIICFIMDKRKTEEIEEEEKKSLLGNEQEEQSDFSVSILSKSETSLDEPGNALSLNERGHNELFQSDKAKEETDGIDIGKIIKKAFFRRKSEYTSPEKKEQSLQTMEKQMYSRFKYDLYRCYLNKESDWENKNPFQKMLFIVLDFPLNLLRDATIPAYEISKWKRFMFILQPYTISLFFIVIFNLYSLLFNFWYIALIWFSLVSLIAFVFYRISYRTSLPNCDWALLSSAFIISILWLWFLTNILMDMIVTFKLLLPIDIPQSFLSMTVLAVGNSLPDFIVNTSLARTGYAEMALSGSIGAPVFGILFGFGMSIVKRLITQMIDGKISSTPFELFTFDANHKNTFVLLSGISCISTVLVGLMICGVVMKFRIKKCASFFGYSVYSVFICLIVYFTFIHPKIFYII